MFSFHKPKIYRSLSGCCICKAKSSSSRFTDSKKYESEFERCFRIIEKRSGEICNACVLLVKRWKKLPLSTTRNWNHVVDARAGPGTKSIKSKFISNNNNNDNNNNTSTTTTSLNHNQLHRKHLHNNHKKLLKPKNIKGLNTSDSNISTNNRGEDNLSELSVVQNHIPSPDASDSSDDEIEEDIEDMEEEIEVQKINKKMNENSNKLSLDDSSKLSKVNANNKRNICESDSPTNTANKISSFLDMSFWRKEKICCGVIFKGPDNEVLIYPKLLEPCFCRKNKSDIIKSKMNANVNSGSSDSGSVGSLSLIEDDINSNASSGNVSPL